MEADMLTPRRRRRVSTTPQNMLRALSMAFVREQESHGVDDRHQPQGEEGEGEAEGHQDGGIEEAGHETDQFGELHAPAELMDEVFDKNTTQAPRSDVDYDFDVQPDNMPLEEHDMASVEQFTPKPLSRGFSDIAMPEGIMDDEGMEDGEEYSLIQEGLQSNPFLENGKDSSSSAIVAKKNAVSTRKSTSRQSTLKNDPLGSKRVYKHLQTLSKRPFAPDCSTVIREISNEFFDQISQDLVSFADHSDSKSIALKSSFLLLKRQRLVRTQADLVQIVNDRLPMEDLQELRLHLHKLDKL